MEIPLWQARGMPLTVNINSQLNYDNNKKRDIKKPSMSHSVITSGIKSRLTCDDTKKRLRNKSKRSNRIIHRVPNEILNDNVKINQLNRDKNLTCFNCSLNNDDRTSVNSSIDESKQYYKFDCIKRVCRNKLRSIFNYQRYGPIHCLWYSIIIIIISSVCISATDQCAQGLKTPGRTWPAGDIVLEEGEPLRILCMLNKTHIDDKFPGKNSSDLIFFRSNKEMDNEFINIINETTIEMYVNEPPPSKDMYYCKLKLNDEYNKKYEPVCLNNVVVGSKPKEPENFTCISNNWENMTCTWDPVPNYVETRFTLLFKLPGRAGGRKLYPCPKEREDQKPPPKKNRCFWSGSTNPIYRLPYEYYTFILNAENVLGNLSTSYKFHHYAHVIPAKPGNLTVVNKTSESVLLHWTVEYPMGSFPPGLHHRVAYQPQWDSRDTWQVINITSDIHTSERYFNLTGLKFANTIYDIRVFMKSALAIGEDKWSQFSNYAFRTSPRLPGQPPRTDIGSFEIAENSASRDVYLYWQAIPAYLENGDNFKYHITSVEESGRKLFLLPNETTRTYAKFKGLSFNNYKFELVTSNIVGAHPEKAVIFVPSRFEIPHEPLAFTKIAFEEGLYELSWKPPIMNAEIKNYTIFWCDNERDRPYQCTGFLDWVHVSKETTIYNMTVPDPRKVYQFAISANTERSSSGMVWASCTVIHNKVVGKMKSVWINRIGSDFIEVGWKLDCSDRIGIVEGFNIYYCPIITPHNLNCKEPRKNTTIKADPHTIHGVVTGLKPYTTYIIQVAVLTKSGEGLHSDALYNTTMEAAPTTPRNVTIKNITNSTMFVSWEPPTAMNGVLRYYEVHYSGNIQKIEESTHVQLNDLVAYKNYSIRVSACTVSCSTKSPAIYQLTTIGLPGKINRVPVVRFINSSQVSVVWSKPQNPAGNLDYYQISSRDGEIQNSTTIHASLSIPDCNTEGRNRMHTFKVRAVNIANNGQHLYGPWSDTGEGNCYSGGPSSSVLVIIWVIGSIGGLAFVFCLIYSSKRMWLKCKAMQDVEVRLPPGLAREKLLQKVGEQHMRQSSADSSGCSSGQESVTSSLTSDSHVSTDSGTEIDPVISPNKLIESTGAWESSSLRQRNVGTTRPSGVPETARWDSYVKISKPGEPGIDDNLSLARSTPNLTDSSGFMMPQHTWSSTGYISMPSSEELSNPSPLLDNKETTIGGYSVVGVLPKSSRGKLDQSEHSSNLIKPENVPYVSLATLEAKPREKKPIDNIKNLDELAKFIDPPVSKIEPLKSVSVLDQTASKPYVQTGLINSIQSQLGDNKRDASIFPSNLDAGTFASTFSPRKLTQGIGDATMKPYVAVGALPDIVTPKLPTIDDNRQQETSPVAGATKPYVLASSVFQMLQQKDKNDDKTLSTDVDKSDESLSSNYPLFWENEDGELIKCDDTVKIDDKNTGYVTVTDLKQNDKQLNDKTSSPYVQHQNIDKVKQSSSGTSDEQYSKVAVAPRKIQ